MHFADGNVFRKCGFACRASGEVMVASKASARLHSIRLPGQAPQLIHSGILSSFRLAVVNFRLRAVGIIQPKNGSLRKCICRSETGGMIGFPSTFVRPGHVAFDQNFRWRRRPVSRPSHKIMLCGMICSGWRTYGTICCVGSLVHR